MKLSVANIWESSY